MLGTPWLPRLFNFSGCWLHLKSPNKCLTDLTSGHIHQTSYTRTPYPPKLLFSGCVLLCVSHTSMLTLGGHGVQVWLLRTQLGLTNNICGGVGTNTENTFVYMGLCWGLLAPPAQVCYVLFMSLCLSQKSVFFSSFIRSLSYPREAVYILVTVWSSEDIEVLEEVNWLRWFPSVFKTTTGWRSGYSCLIPCVCVGFPRPLVSSHNARTHKLATWLLEVVIASAKTLTAVQAAMENTWVDKYFRTGANSFHVGTTRLTTKRCFSWRIQMVDIIGHLRFGHRLTEKLVTKSAHWSHQISLLIIFTCLSMLFWI